MKLKRAIVLGKGKWGKIFISRLRNKVKIVYIDMDGLLVDFQSGINSLSDRK